MHDLLFGLLIGGLVLLLKVKFEDTELGKLAEQASYEFLQHRLTLTAPSSPLPVTIVDISPIEAVETDNGSDRGTYKPRKPLTDLVKTIAEKGPAAISVDLEFSPRADNSLQTAEDPEFFAACQDIVDKLHIPVYLGVHRGASAPDPAGWLGLPDFKDLAVNVVIPRKRNTPVLVRWSEVPTKPAPLRLPSMSAALAAAYRKKVGTGAEETGQPGFLAFAVEKAAPGGANAFATEEYLVDYSTVNALRESAIHARSGADVANQDNKLRGRIVLLGNADFDNLPPDSFIVPGQDQPVPGVYIHAAGATTLINGPLFDVTLAGRILLDILFALLVIGSVAAIRVYFERSGTEVSENRLQFVMTLLAVVLVIVLGAFVVRVTRILWNDFLLVALTLWIHPSLERDLPELWRGLTGAARSMVTATEKGEN